MRIDVFTLFPEWFAWMDGVRHLQNARRQGDLETRFFSYRDHTVLSGGQVDDAPFGGGPGMVLRVDVVARAFEQVYGCDAERVRAERSVVVLTPRGRRFTDAVARELAAGPPLTLLCGRYEGFDERIHTLLASDAVSIGPYVLAGGEIPAMAVIDACARRIPGALGNAASLDAESFGTELGGRTEHPHYTRPADFRGHGVPDVLLSGDHGAVARWREAHLGTAPGAELGPRGGAC
ncbi:MAG: tRNA (guanosine(37)-N1)-methyltransferase TrmD [Thermoleophilia bacterium]|nr:tRNA (guanosine(37)-N1)-methyltransferase TrmD [Thermoleophilia bacterium]